MSAEKDYTFAKYEEYIGTAEEVTRQIEECQICGAKLLVSHIPDYKNLLIQETSKCLECAKSNKKVIHIIN